MFVLHVQLTAQSGSQAHLAKIFFERFYPAISSQAGFISAELLRSIDSATDYRLCLSFDQQTSQQKWVATELHQEVWQLIEGLCETYSVAGYTAV